MKADKHNLHKDNITYKYSEMLDTIYTSIKLAYTKNISRLSSK